MGGWEVLDTATKIGLGAIIGAISSHLLERYKKADDLERENLRIRQDRIIDPIVSFIDEVLVLSSESYWTDRDGFEAERERRTILRQKMAAMRAKEGIVLARVHSLGDKDLGTGFSELFRVFSKICDQVERGKDFEAASLCYEIAIHAGGLLKELYVVRASH